MSESLKLLVVDTDPSFRTEIEQGLARAGIAVSAAGGVSEARDLVAATPFDAVLVDLDFPEDDSLELVDDLVAAAPAPLVLVVAHHPRTRRVVEAIHRGAADVLEKPLSPHRLTHLLLSRAGPSSPTAPEEPALPVDPPVIVGSGPAWRGVLERASRVAATRDNTLLVQGEAGTGKELIARSIHQGGHRRGRPFVTLNCAALNESILEAELFGFEAGAFTGATREGKPGMLETADGGTVLLEEIGEISAGLQAQLLGFLQERRFRRVGGVRDQGADVRIIAATGRDLWRDVEKGRFRKDLYFRISEMPIVLPPLRERREDIVELAAYFLRRFAAGMHKPLRGFTPAAEELLRSHDWIGNARELRNACEYAAILCDGHLVEPHHLVLQHQRALRRGESDGELALPLRSRSLRDMEQELIRVVLTENRFNVTRAARALGINRSTLYNKMREYGLQREPLRELQQSE